MIEGIIQEFLFNYRQIILFLKSHHSGKWSHHIFLYVIGYNNISWRLHDPTPKSERSRTTNPQDWRIYAWVCTTFSFSLRAHILIMVAKLSAIRSFKNTRYCDENRSVATSKHNHACCCKWNYVHWCRLRKGGKAYIPSSITSVRLPGIFQLTVNNN